MSKNKKDLGQFYTTNYQYILQNLNINDNITDIIEPFAGKGDLLYFFQENINKYNIECYDIEPKIKKDDKNILHKINIIKQDTLNNPPIYKNKFVITNPPYLARNKSDKKDLYNKYNANDLYKCFIEQLINDTPIGGILIIPLNFWCSIRKNDIQIRKRFLEKFDIIHMNIFEESVFDDTSYSVCSFQFQLKIEKNKSKEINVTIYPKKINIVCSLNSSNNFLFGGEIYKLKQQPKIKIDRLTHKNRNINSKYNTNILLKCLDDNKDSKLCLSYIDNDNNNNDNDNIKKVNKYEKYIDNTEKLTGRSYAILIINKELTKEKQLNLINKFNFYINDMRVKYNSLFLTNYRESNTIARKRISFSLAFEIVNYLLDND